MPKLKFKNIQLGGLKKEDVKKKKRVEMIWFADNYSQETVAVPNLPSLYELVHCQS